MGRRIATIVALFFTVGMALLITPAEAASAPPDFAVANGHFYSQGAAGAQGGFTITDDGGVPMWSEYSRLGGPDELGYPVSGRFLLDGKVVQLTQRAGLVWRQDLHQVRFLDIFSMLHNAGKDGWLLSTKGIPPQASAAAEAGKTWQQISQKRYTLLDAHPAIKAAYFAMKDPVNMYGLPASSWMEQPAVSTLRFDNVVFQQWKQLVPWAAAGAVELANGGDILKESGILGPTPFAVQAAPAPVIQPIPTSTIQGVSAGFAVASFYADYFVGRHTSTGAVFTQQNYTCATNAFPLGTRLRLSTLDGRHSVIVVNNDRPAAWNTRIDLSKAAFAALYPLGRGTGQVKIEVLR